MTIEIRRLLPGDDAVLGGVAEEVFDEPVDPARLAAYLAAPDHLMIVALSNGIVVGQCAAVVHRHPDKATELYIDEVGVSPAFQRRGIAREMLAAMSRLAGNSGAQRPGSGPSRTTSPRVRFTRRCRKAPIRRKAS